ncbi:hypothetical protein [Ferruginibacter sp.]
MKFYLFIFLPAIFLFTACSNKEKTVTTVGADGTITETALPKGKFIIDDETAFTNLPQDPTTLNGTGGQDTTTIIPAVKQDPKANLKRRYKNLLVFHAKDTMKINKAYIAKLILGKDQILSTIKEEVLKNSGSAKDEVVEDTTVDIGSKMKAELTPLNDGAGKGFEIEPIGSAIQSINDKRKKAIWTWKITPLTAGEQHLVLSINIIEKEDEMVNLPTKDIPIVIFAEPESMMNKVAGFFEKNYQWLLATLLIPLFMGWYNARMRHKFDKKMVESRFPNEKPPTLPNNQPVQSVNTPKNNESNS